MPNEINPMEDEKDDSGIEQDNNFIYIRIAVEDHNLQKVLKFNLDDTVWTAKLKVLQVLVRVKIVFMCEKTLQKITFFVYRNYPIV
jgi:hypothetical protein